MFTPPITRVAERHHAGTGLGVYGGSAGEWGWHLDDYRPSHDRQRRGAYFRVRQHPGECQHHLASGLSFLGLGASPPNAEWGLMLNTLRQSIYVNTWVPVLPGVMIFLTSMAFNLLSDGLRDAMDVRL